MATDEPAATVDAQGRYWYGTDRADKQALLGRLRRIEGQVRGVHRMVEEDSYCIDVLTQISAATRALQAVALGLLEGHLAHCVVDAARDGGDPSAKVKEAADAIARLVRS
jgi:DNA-binding FrmR family transcriptional regulator